MAPTLVRRTAGNPWRRTLGRVLVLAGDEIHELTGGAALVWDELGTPRTLEQLCQDLGITTGATAEQIEAAVDALVTRSLAEVTG